MLHGDGENTIHKTHLGNSFSMELHKCVFCIPYSCSINIVLVVTLILLFSEWWRWLEKKELWQKKISSRFCDHLICSWRHSTKTKMELWQRFVTINFDTFFTSLNTFFSIFHFTTCHHLCVSIFHQNLDIPILLWSCWWRLLGCRKTSALNWIAGTEYHLNRMGTLQRNTFSIR